MEEALASIERFIQERLPRQVVTVDANALVLAQRDVEFRQILSEADLITPDGIGILWAAQRCGTPLPERVPGVELMAKLVQLSQEKGYRLFLLGAAPKVAEAAACNLLNRYPAAQLVGTHHGYFQPEEEPDLLERIRQVKPDVLLVAMGMPKQEKWIAAHKQRLQVPVSIGVGGSFDVFAGRVKRAPPFFQKHGLEWLWRLMQDPRKLSKVRNLPYFVWLVIRKQGKDS